MLSAEQIQLRLDIFNETNDWGVFSDVPAEQQVNVMYPHRIRLLGELANPNPRISVEELQLMYSRLVSP